MSSSIARDDAIAALTVLARSDDWADRAAAGQALAVFADVPAAHGMLGELLRDRRDEGVIVRTAEALLRRHDRSGISLFVTADFDDHTLIDALAGVVWNVFNVFTDERDAALTHCVSLAGSDDPDVRDGAGVVAAWLQELNPPLRPARRP